jgi:hypothetical protein
MRPSAVRAVAERRPPERSGVKRKTRSLQYQEEVFLLGRISVFGMGREVEMKVPGLAMDEL